MQTMQYLAGLALPAGWPARFEQPGGSGIALQDIDVFVHDEYRQRHDIE